MHAIDKMSTREKTRTSDVGLQELFIVCCVSISNGFKMVRSHHDDAALAVYTDESAINIF